MNHPRLKLDLTACILLVAGMLIILSVLSHDVRLMGAPDGLNAAAERNFLGLPGAWLGHMLFDTLGVAVYAFIACWFVVVFMMFQRRSVLKWVRRLSGWLMLLPCAALAADYLGTLVPAKSLSGSGGTLGAWLNAIMEDSLPLAARWFLFGGAALLGICLSIDFVVLAAAKLVSRFVAIIRPRLSAAGRLGWKVAARLVRPFARVFRRRAEASAIAGKRSARGKYPRLAMPEAGDDGAIPIHHHDQSQETLVSAPSQPSPTPAPAAEPVPIRRLMAVPDKDNG